MVTTLTETLKIQQEGRIARQNAQQELATIENQLKQVLLDNMNQSR